MPQVININSQFTKLDRVESGHNELTMLVRDCIAQVPAAQKKLYDQYAPAAYGIIKRYMYNDDATAQEILNDSFYKILTKLDQYTFQGAFEGWIRRIIVHTCINFLKKYKKFNESMDLTYATNLQSKDETVPSMMQGKQVVECIRILPLGYKTVLNLYAIEGFSHREIGLMLDIEESTSRSQYTRAKAMLETLLIKKRIIEKPKEDFNWLAVFPK